MSVDYVFFVSGDTKTCAIKCHILCDELNILINLTRRLNENVVLTVSLIKASMLYRGKASVQ